jgi:hypothetical protein
MRKFLLAITAIISINCYAATQTQVKIAVSSESIPKIEQLTEKVQQSIALESGLMQNFSNGYFSEQYLILHPEITERLNKYCGYHISNNDKEVYNCTQASLHSNFWHKFYVYGGLILNLVSFKWMVLIMLCIGALILFMLLKLIANVGLITKTSTSYFARKHIK